jgi:hypothetical protein
MIAASFLAVLLFSAPPKSIGGIAVPPDTAVDDALTKAATKRAADEMKNVLAQLDRDARPAAVKDEIRRKIARLKVFVLTSTHTVDEVVRFYEQTISEATFQFAGRGLVADLDEVSRIGGFSVDPETRKKWETTNIKSARWSRSDGSVEIDVEDHLIDPRDGAVSEKTVLLITTTVN